MDLRCSLVYVCSISGVEWGRTMCDIASIISFVEGRRVGSGGMICWIRSIGDMQTRGGGRGRDMRCGIECVIHRRRRCVRSYMIVRMEHKHLGRALLRLPLAFMTTF